MFAPRISKGGIKASESSSERPTIRNLSRDASEERTPAPTESWSFGAIPVFPPGRDATLIVNRQRHAFSATLPAVGQGHQNDAMNADERKSGAQPNPLPETGGLKPGRQEGEAIPIPDGMLTSISGEQADAIRSNLGYQSTIAQKGVSPADFGKTRYDFTPENFTLSQRAGTPGTPSSPGITGTPAIPPAYEVNGDIVGTITFQVDNHGRTDIATYASPSITQSNYPAVVKDLTPPSAPVNQGGLSLLKNQPPRTKFWARDLTIKHELFHCAEDQRFGGQGVQSAQNWLNSKTASTSEQVFALLPEIIKRIGNAVTTARASPADEQRAWDDGGPGYLARAQAIKTKGDAKGYVPKPPAPAPQVPGSPPVATPKDPVGQPAPPPKRTP